MDRAIAGSDDHAAGRRHRQRPRRLGSSPTCRSGRPTARCTVDGRIARDQGVRHPRSHRQRRTVSLSGMGGHRRRASEHGRRFGVQRAPDRPDACAQDRLRSQVGRRCSRRRASCSTRRSRRGAARAASMSARLDLAQLAESSRIARPTSRGAWTSISAFGRGFPTGSFNFDGAHARFTGVRSRRCPRDGRLTGARGAHHARATPRPTARTSLCARARSRSSRRTASGSSARPTVSTCDWCPRGANPARREHAGVRLRRQRSVRLTLHQGRRHARRVDIHWRGGRRRHHREHRYVGRLRSVHGQRHSSRACRSPGSRASSRSTGCAIPATPARSTDDFPSKGPAATPRSMVLRGGGRVDQSRPLRRRPLGRRGRRSQIEDGSLKAFLQRPPGDYRPGARDERPARRRLALGHGVGHDRGQGSSDAYRRCSPTTRCPVTWRSPTPVVRDIPLTSAVMAATLQRRHARRAVRPGRGARPFRGRALAGSSSTARAAPGSTTSWRGPISGSSASCSAVRCPVELITTGRLTGPTSALAFIGDATVTRLDVAGVRALTTSGPVRHHAAARRTGAGDVARVQRAIVVRRALRSARVPRSGRHGGLPRRRDRRQPRSDR